MIKPDYYFSSHGIDVIEYARIMFGLDAAKAFCRINVIKYITRYDKKNGIEDLLKAITYLERLIELEMRTNEPTD